MRASFLAANACRHDAIGSQLAAKAICLRELDWEVRVYVESDTRLHPALGDCTVAIDAQSLWRDPEQRGYLLSSDLIVVELASQCGLFDLLPRLARSPARIVVHYHGVTPPEHWPSAQRDRLEAAQAQRGLAWCADQVLATSRFTRKELHQATGLPLEDIGLLPCCIGDVGPALTRDVRHAFGLEDAVVLLYVGRMAANKRTPLLVEAVARLRDVPRPVHAVLIGDTEDIYAAEARRCHQCAEELGVADRVHLLGQVDDTTLAAWYRAGDMLVIPSLHEGFCVPVVEAMAHGLPVIAARTSVLPETVGSAGLTFEPNDAEDLARNVRRVLDERVSTGSGEPSRIEQPSAAPLAAASEGGAFRVAIVSPRFGQDIIGGAERSLRLIATSLARAGHQIEVFTTCAVREGVWKNDRRAGTEQSDGLLIHRFPVDPIDALALQTAVEAIEQLDGMVSEEMQRRYLENSLQSAEMIRSLQVRSRDFDAIVVGPCLFGLSCEVARTFPDKTVLLPCFHDEPVARLPLLRDAYRNVAAILYHSEEEKSFAEADLGINVPGATVIGTYLDSGGTGSAERGRSRCGENYVVYCGRYSAEKNVDTLLSFAGRYAVDHPGQLKFVFMGQGDLPLPRAHWLINLGVVSEETKRDVLAGARALIQLSTRESLSLVALETWGEGVPLIAHRRCAVLADLIQRSGGGETIDSYEEFADALDRLTSEPNIGEARGAAGRRYVREHYTSPEGFTVRLVAVLQSLHQPLATRMRDAGRVQARKSMHSSWRQHFLGAITAILDQPKRRRRLKLEVTPWSTRQNARPGSSIALSLKIANGGELPAVITGPTRTRIGWRISRDEVCIASGWAPLPRSVLPGRTETVAISLRAPKACGAYHVAVAAASSQSRLETLLRRRRPLLQLEVRTDIAENAQAFDDPLIAEVKELLAAAARIRTLPDEYHDVTHGPFASLKRGIKQKLLNNFRRGYVDVLSRRQSAFNELVLTVLCQLAEQCGRPSSVVRGSLQETDSEALIRLVRRLIRNQKTIERRLAELEARLVEPADVEVEP